MAHIERVRVAELIGGPCDGAEVEDDSVSSYVIPWDTGMPDALTVELAYGNTKYRHPLPDALYVLNPADGNYHFNGFIGA